MIGERIHDIVFLALWLLLACSTVACAEPVERGDANPPPLTPAERQEIEVLTHTEPRTPEQEARLRELIHRWETDMNRLAARVLSTLHVAGDVVGEDGKPLKGVRYVADLHKPPTWQQAWNGGGPPPDRKEATIDEPFDLSFPGYPLAEVWFEKDGYYSAKISLNHLADRSAADLRSALARGDVQLHPDKPGQVRVVLMKKGTPTKLAQCRGKLLFSASGRSSLLDLAVERPQHFHQLPAVNLNDKPALPPTALYLTADTAGEGADARIVVFMVRAEGRGRDWPSAKGLVLRTADKDGGFIPFPRGGPLVPASAAPFLPRHMRQAPEAGYRPELPLRGEDLVRIDDVGQGFYFKLGGKYGRGVVTSAGPSRNGSEVEATLELHWQPDGSRNLEDPKLAN